ncbi:uncharacterized protein BXIN_2957 [Babesia sp. Xinjiang]|uniref:uncharacterized protein n=1 Tax=Babesia sp. Xinjiang TaxID=462227 RepID=UPI000A23EA06|nr:uncharacterized protein BXIN_2957 [Babesia sp. Xinjiang]ORM39482.1 hypothetical protein BXIN_2957 [Babesia sp. Xinjiang]
MSLQFLREFNKNVKESLSILNEGIEITNGVTDIGNIHLPYIQQLVKLPQDIQRPSSCCLFLRTNFTDRDDTKEGTDASRSACSAQSLGTTASRHSTTEETVETLSDGIENGNAGADTPRSAIDSLPCPLGEACIINRIDKRRYEASLEEITNFLNNVENALETRSAATRSLLETQVLPVLCLLVDLSELACLFQNPPKQLSNKFGDVKTVNIQVLGIIASSIKLIDDVLTYPKFITAKTNRKVVEYTFKPNIQHGRDILEANNVAGIIPDAFTSTQLTDALNRTNNLHITTQSNPDNTLPSGYAYIGKLALVTLTEEERDRLKHTLGLVHSVAIATEFGRTLLNAAAISLGGSAIEQRDIVLFAVKVIEKLYTHNDVGYHLHHSDDQLLCTVDNLDDFYRKWIIACNGICFQCDRNLGIDAIADEPLCDCLYHQSDTVAPNRHLIEDELLSSELNAHKLMRLVMDSGDMVLKTCITRLILQMVISSAAFRRRFVLDGCIEILIHVLDGCYTDQFAVIVESLAQIQENITKKQTATLDRELTIAMEFLPYNMDALLILRQCIRYGDWGRTDVSRILGFVTQLTYAILNTWIYYYIYATGTPSDKENSTFTRSLSIVIDMCSDLANQSNANLHCDTHAALVVVAKLRNSSISNELGFLREIIDSGIMEHVMFAAHILYNRTRFGFQLPQRVVDALMRFVSTVAIASQGSAEATNMLLQRMKTPSGKQIPPLYTHIYQDLLSRELDALKTSITSQFTARIQQFRVEMFGDFANIPVLMHWLLCLNDNHVVDSMNDAYRWHLSKLIASTGLYKLNEMASGIFEYSRDLYHHNLSMIEGYSNKGTSELDWRPIRNYLELSICMMAYAVDHTKDNGEDTLTQCINVLNKVLSEYKVCRTKKWIKSFADGY